MQSHPNRRWLRWIIGLAVAGIVATGVFAGGVAMGRWSNTSVETQYASDGWVLRSVDYGQGDAQVVTVKSDGDAYLITTGMNGLGFANDDCKHPAFVYKAKVVSSGDAFAVWTGWERRGCELGPSSFQFRVSGLSLPFDVGVVQNNACDVATFDDVGIVNVVRNGPEHPACGGFSA